MKSRYETVWLNEIKQNTNRTRDVRENFYQELSSKRTQRNGKLAEI